jgi:hypothetical protein
MMQDSLMTSAPWPTAAELRLKQLQAKWAGHYEIDFAGGAYHAVSLFGGRPITTATLDGLESSIRAHWARWDGR